MIDIVDLFHYLIGIILVSFLIWVIIKIHLHFSKNNKSLEEIMNKFS
jgi:flagellar biogenesis protein FliO